MPAAAALELTPGLPVRELCQPRRYVGTVADVTPSGPHRVLRFSVACFDGRALCLWVSCAVLEGERGRQLSRAIHGPRGNRLAIGFRGRFGDLLHPTRLTADIHDADDIWVHAADDLEAPLP